jgi:nicotinamidase-related amidase
VAPSVSRLIASDRTVVVTQELQRGVVGDLTILPELAAAAEPAVAAAAKIVVAAREAGVAVVHCVAARRADGRGSNANARLFTATARLGSLEPGSPAVEVVPELGPEPEDIVLARLHGVGPMGGTDLDGVLRHLGARTVVGVGVSVNVGMTSFVMDAVNAGYQFVLPRDAVAGVPAEYADAVIDNSLALLATVTTTDAIVDAWATAAP